MYRVKVNYDFQLLSCVDWRKRSVWKTKATPVMLGNQLFRMMHTKKKLSNIVYDMIVSKARITNDDVLKCIRGRLGQLNDDIFEEVLAKVGKHSAVVCLILSRNVCSLAVLQDIIDDLKDIGIKDETEFKPQNKCDKILIPELFAHVGNYCKPHQLLQICGVSRLWYRTIMNVKFLQQCKSFQMQQLLGKQVRNFNHEHSSQWCYEQIKILKINATSRLLEKYKFPQFNQDSIQYLIAAKWHLTKIPDSLVAVKVLGYDETLHYIEAKDWDTIPSPKLKLAVGVKCQDFIPSLPDAQAKFYDECELSRSTLKSDIINPQVGYIGLQNCDVIGRVRGRHTWLSKPIDECVPNVNLNIVDTSCWAALHRLLNDQNLFDKKIKKIRVVSKYDKIDEELPPFLKLITDVTNPNEPKKISLLFYSLPDTPKMDQNDTFSITWILNNWDNFHSNPNINEFNLGILKVNKNDVQYSWCADLMKLPDSWKDTLQAKWSSVLHTETELFKVDANNQFTTKWDELFAQIESEMLMQ